MKSPPERCPDCGETDSYRARYATGGGWRPTHYVCDGCGRRHDPHAGYERFILSPVQYTSMNRVKVGIAAIAGLAAGLLTLRTVKRRRTDPKKEAETAVQDAVDEATAAADHAAAALGHASVAAEKTTEYASEEFGAISEVASNGNEKTASSVGGRLRQRLGR